MSEQWISTDNASEAHETEELPHDATQVITTLATDLLSADLKALDSEHNLRSFVQLQRTRLEDLDRALNEHNASWHITYVGADGGHWYVESYRHSVKLQGAELARVVTCVIDTVMKVRSIKTLRGLLT
jgi:chemotaxis protein histidine kinase CheA